jgi:ribose transport system permease protein
MLKKSLFRTIIGRSDTSTIAAAVILFVTFSVTSSSFLTGFNMFNVSRTAALYVFVALGQAMAIIVGGMNMSLGAIGGLATVIAGFFMHVLKWPVWASCAVALATGIVAGGFNGFIITRLKLNSFVVTLATLFIFTGITFGVTRGFPYTNIPDSFVVIGKQGFLEVPYLFWLMLVALAIVYYIFRYTYFGRKLLATGGNIQAARLSGINTDRILLLANVLSGFCAALAGLLWLSRMGSAAPATGQDWLVVSFAVAVIGGTALKGGIISPVGLLFSAIIMTLIKNGLIMLEVNIYFEQSFLGAIILLAVAFERVRVSIAARDGARQGL